MSSDIARQKHENLRHYKG